MIIKSGIPIYLQVVDDIKLKILSGELALGQRIEGVRDLALEYGINPNTIQKAMVTCEELNLVVTIGTNGRYITQDCELITLMRQEMLKVKSKEFIQLMKRLEISQEDLVAEIEKIYQEDVSNE